MLPLTRRVYRSLAGALAACLSTGCATPSYVLFYKRYAGTCQVSSPPTAATEPNRLDPRQAALRDAFVEALNDQEAKLRECYADSLRYGETHGKVRVHVELHPAGHTDHVTLVSDSTTFPALACCVVSLVRDLHFKPTADVAAVSIQYPFSFHTVRTTTVQGIGVAVSSSSANRQGYVAELDESNVVIGGLYMYPVGADGLHYHSDVEQSEEAAGETGKDAGAAH